MNLPNKLTLLRVFMVPVFLVFALIDTIPYNEFIAVGIFALASITDALDGYIARKNNLVTNFGKFLDPLADKVLVMAALLCLVQMGYIGSVPVIIILAREFMVSGLRLVTANEGVVVPAGIWGKLKTAFTMIAIIVIFIIAGLFGQGTVFGEALYNSTEQFENFYVLIFVIPAILIWIATILTVISGVQYLFAYRKYIDTTK
ncbi:MAG TPA: CDP-diacylglycerol--glycerol-3-phosphate 3-phosphatidyltransferase [Oscillospiraceae bacterium]|nr:CDP-diacylglycerol--glycerol-3-phosphate 3-phosphatidyltransferase [Oscillospiraceae bacterium]